MTLRSLPFVALLALAVVSCGGSGTRNIPTGPTQPPVVVPPVVDPPVVKPPTLTITKIMAFGDSLTEGESLGQLLVPTSHNPNTPGVSTSYPAKLQATLTATYTGQTDIQVFNRGLGGEFAIGSAKDRLISSLDLQKPDVLLLIHGVNNVNAADPILTIVEALEEMIEIAYARGVKHVFLGNLPPQRPTTKATGGARIAEFNSWLPSLASEEGATLINLNANVTLDMLMPDGLHITEAGNVKIAELFYAAIKAKYHQDPPQ